MELQQKLELIFDEDAVLRGQGADAAMHRARRPGLVKVAEEARQASISLLHPKVVYKIFETEGVQHERLLLHEWLRPNVHLQLHESGKIESRLMAQQLATASRVIVILATIGGELEEHVSKIWDANMVGALALDGAGSAAVEALANAACQYFEKQAIAEGGAASLDPAQPRDGGLAGG